MDQIAACTGPELNRIHQPCTDSHWLTWPAAMGLVDPPLLGQGMSAIYDYRSYAPPELWSGSLSLLLVSHE